MFTLLLSRGYLTLSQTQKQPKDSWKRELSLEIPNAEIHKIYEERILSRINDGAPDALKKTYTQLRDAVADGNAQSMQEAIQNVLLYVLGRNDTGGKKKEEAYHMLLTGLLGPLMGNYLLTSNGNAGLGRFDIALTPLRHGNPAIIIEVKAGDKKSLEALKALANEALNQIDKKRYIKNPYWTNVEKTFKYGVAFSKKDVHVVFEEELAHH